MDYKKVLEDCNTRAEVYQRQDAAWNLLHERQCAEAISNLIVRAEAAETRCETLEKLVMEYQEELIPGYRAGSEKAKKKLETAVGTIYALVADCPPEACREICANHDGVCSEHAKMGHYDHCKGFKWIGEKEG